MPQKKNARTTPQQRAEQTKEGKNRRRKQWSPGMAKDSVGGTAKRVKLLKQARQDS